jgi:tripartite-type tricarboxylate transporter receptor subunit TctC
MAEALKLDIEMQAFNAIATTKGTPAPILEKLTKAVHAAMDVPAVNKRLLDMGGTPAKTTNEEMGKRIASQVQRWREFVAATGIKGE